MQPGQFLGEQCHALAPRAVHAGYVCTPERRARPERVEHAMQRAEHHPVLIHRAPKVVLLAVQPDEDLVQMPRIPGPRPVSAQSPGEFGAELAAPMADAFVRDHHTTFGEDDVDVPQAQAEKVIQPHCVTDDPARKPTAGAI